MVEQHTDRLSGVRLLVVEDDYLIALDLTQTLEELGIEVVGPAGSLSQALALVGQEGGALDGALLDINIHDQRVYPVADALAVQGIPFVFLTGYDRLIVPERYADVPRCEKPMDTVVLPQILIKVLNR
jgi:CheY-like chemotaxis protein